MTEKANLLALDAASPEPAVVVLARGELFEERLSADRRASEELLPAIRRALDRAGLTLSDLSRVAACAGPGSFTGLRVGLATAWGLATGAGLPMESVGTLEAMAEAARDSGAPRVWTALDAGRGEIVLQGFDLSGPRAEALGPPRRGPAAIARGIPAGEPVFPLPSDLPGLPAERLFASPARALALACARQPRASDERGPRPIYSRASAAEEKRGAA